jgi:hypothetical protein
VHPNPYEKQPVTEGHVVAGSATAVSAASLPSLAVEMCGPDISPTLLLAAEALTDTPFSCLAFARAFRPEIIPQLRHAVVRNGGQLLGVLSFYRRGEVLVVVNRLVRLADEVLEVCAAAMLQENPTARSIEINDLYNARGRLPTAWPPALTWRTIDCVAAALPRSFTEYLANFGSATRKNLRYCARRLEREAPGLKFLIQRREEIAAETVEAIVQLNHRRMAFKSKASGIDDLYTSRLAALMRSHGAACVAADGPTIVAATLCTEVGHGWTLHVIAHDPRFNHVRLGLLCLLKTMEAAIDSGARRFNFLWGVGEYKVLFGGELDTLRARRYYRNAGNRLLAIGDMRDCVAQSARRRLSLWRRRYQAR